MKKLWLGISLCLFFLLGMTFLTAFGKTAEETMNTEKVAVEQLADQ